MFSRHKHTIIYLLFVCLVIGLYAWYVRGVSFSRIFPYGTPHAVGDPVRGQWSARADMPTARTAVGAVAYGDAVYVVGGLDGLGRTLQTVELYRPETDHWESAPPLPKAVHSASVVALDGYVYVLGGFDGLSLRPTNEGFVFDTVTGTWQHIAPMPEARGAMAAAVLGDTLAVVGGLSADGVSRALFVYLPTENRWETRASMPTARDHLAVAVLEGKLYAIGGRKGQESRPLTVVEVYDRETDRWQTAPQLPRPVGDGAVAVRRNSLIVAGGEVAPRMQADVYRLAHGGDHWETLTGMRTPRHGFGFVTVRDALYAIGGGTHPGFSVSSLVETLGFGE
jgi:N-acetylneuraminic acid mutarotase